MPNLEFQILSNIIKTGDLKTLQMRGISPDSFESFEAQELYQWLLDEFGNPKNPGKVPSLARVKRKFPDLDYCPTRDPLEALVGELQELNVAQGIREAYDQVEALLEEGQSPIDVIQGFLLPTARDLCSANSATNALTLKQAVGLIRASYNTMAEAGGLTGIAYPWAPLNKSTAGMQPEEFIVVYGRPKNMKTWLLCAMAAHAFLESNKRVVFYSKEMSTIQIARRVASIIAGVDYEKLKTGSLSQQEEEDFFDCLDFITSAEGEKVMERKGAGIEFLSDREISGKGGATVEMIGIEAEKFGADIVFVDGFYLIRDGRTGVRSRDWKQISNISSDLKTMAQNLKVPVVGSTQANRGAIGSKGDDTGEAAYADAIGQDCDLMMRTFKGMNARTGRPKLMLTFPAARDAVLNPFVVNASPGDDFSLLQATVDVDAFLKDKELSDKEEEDSSKSGGDIAKKNSKAQRAFGDKKPATRIR